MTDRSYPDALEIKPLKKPPEATIRVPGSKSITNRALVLGALCSKGMDHQIRGALHSEDTEVMVQGLRELGFRIWSDEDRPEGGLHISSEEADDMIPAHGAELFAANSGTTIRFLTALVSLGRGKFRLDGSPRMRQRPIEYLSAALCQLGAKVYSERGNNCPPVIVEANGLRGGHAHIPGDISSQFLSALLMVAPFAREPVSIQVEGPLVSWPYVTMTIDMMQRMQIPVTVESGNAFQVNRPR